MGIYTYYSPLAQFGVKVQWKLTQSNVSAVPRFFYSVLTINKGPFASTLAYFGFISKGIKNLDNFILLKGGHEEDR